MMADYIKGDVRDADQLWEKANPLFTAAVAPCTESGVADDYAEINAYTIK